MGRTGSGAKRPGFWEGGGVQNQGISFFLGGGEGVELRGSGPQVPNPGLCMVIILKIFKMKEKMRWRDT